MKINWKVIAITETIILVLLISLIIWGYSLNAKEEKMIKLCYYEICSEYIQADYLDGVCTCYDTDMLGDFVVAKTKVME